MKNGVIVLILALWLPFAANAALGQEPSLKAIKRQAEMGNAQAQYILGRKYENGDGVGESAAKALEWYRKAAQQNLAPAQYALGRMYASGDGTRADYAE